MTNRKWIVVTTINPPTEAIHAIARLARDGWSAVVVGDGKTPADWSAEPIHYLSIGDQQSQFGELAEAVPRNHYCRKNLGYLYAIARGAECILETDDDNIPYADFGHDIARTRSAREASGAEWINVYQYFTADRIWPRGLPLDEIDSIGTLNATAASHDFPIQQYLADGDPDVDAVYRLVTKATTDFAPNPNLSLAAGSWSPFNSQNTLFFREAFPLLYLPCHVSFRMTDIWRSFVAQQALWVRGQRLVFLPATVRQVRNQHDLMKDFADEIPGYLENKRIARILAECAKGLSPDMDTAFIALSLWEALNRHEIIPDREMAIIDQWMRALAAATTRATAGGHSSKE